MKLYDVADLMFGTAGDGNGIDPDVLDDEDFFKFNIRRALTTAK